MTTKETISQQLTSYLNHQLTLAELVGWAEHVILDGNIQDADPKKVMRVLGRIAASDAEGFGLLWEDCDDMLRELGYRAHVNVTKAA